MYEIDNENVYSEGGRLFLLAHDTLTFFLPPFPIAHTVICRPFGLCAEFLAERVYNEYLIPVVVSTAFVCTLLAHVILEWCHIKYIYIYIYV